MTIPLSREFTIDVDENGDVIITDSHPAHLVMQVQYDYEYREYPVKLFSTQFLNEYQGLIVVQFWFHKSLRDRSLGEAFVIREMLSKLMRG